MAVLIEAFSVVAERSTIEERYPGGSEAFRRNCHNSTFCADEHLCRVAFMASHDLDWFVSHLEGVGFQPLRESPEATIALIHQSDGVMHPRAWLEVGQVAPGVLAAWSTDGGRGELATPDGWAYESSLSTQSTLFAEEDLEGRGRYEFAGKRDGLDVYRDCVTSEGIFVGRVAAGSGEPCVAVHNQLFQEAAEVAQQYLILEDPDLEPLTQDQVKELRAALGLLLEVVSINPWNWTSHWFAGKIHERMEDDSSALDSFKKALEINESQVDSLREASCAAMRLGTYSVALEYATRATQAEPEDAGLLANRALMKFRLGDLRGAFVDACEARRRDPDDPITAALLEEIRAGLKAAGLPEEDSGATTDDPLSD